MAVGASEVHAAAGGVPTDGARSDGLWGLGAGVDVAATGRAASAASYDSYVSRLKDICIDCADPWRLAHWWAPVLDYVVRPHSDDDLAQLRADGFSGPEDDPSIATDPADGVGPTIWFNRVAEPKRGKNRVHVDVFGDAQALVGNGARLLGRRARWTVLADPEGNEFCVFPPASPE